MATTNFYSCSSSSAAADDAEDAAVPLLLTGAKKLSLSYQYEIENSSTSSSSIDEAIERVQDAMLFNIAKLSGLVDCPTTTMENSVEEENSSWRRNLGDGIDSITQLQQSPPQQQQQQWQGLRGLQVESAAAPPRGRGSNSIVGLSSLPVDYALMDVPCHSVAEARSISIGGSGENDLFSSSTRHVSPGMAGMVAIGEQEEDSVGEVENQNMIVIDGKPVYNVINAIAPRSISHSQQLEEEEEEGAFNYISTQSKPKSASTLHTLHNPSFVSHDVLLQQPQSSFKSSGSTHLLPLARSIDVNNNIGINQNSDSGRQNKCTVIQGNMSIYTLSPTTTTTSSTSSIDDYSTYENLQGRILYAIASTLHSNTLGIPKNHQDEIRAVRMHSDVPYAMNDSTGTGGGGSMGVSAINSAQSSTTYNNNLAFLSNVPMIPIMIGMSILLLAVLALFVSTSRPNKRRRGNNDNNNSSKEETSTIMSAKTIDIDLDAGEEVEYQSPAANSNLRDVDGTSNLNKRTRSGGIGVLAKNIIGRQRSSDGGVLERGEEGGVCGVEEVGIPKRVGGSTEANVVVPNTPKSIRYDSTSLPSPTRRTPMRSMNNATSSSLSTSPPVIPSTPQTPKPRVRSVARPRAVSPDVEVELYDCLFPSSPAAASCKSRNSILTQSPSGGGGSTTDSHRGQVQKRSAAGYLDMLATTFCVNPQYYEDVEVCLKPVDDCTEYVDNKFCSPVPPATPSFAARKIVVPVTPTSTTKNNTLQEKEMSARRKKKSINSSVDGVPNYVFTEDGGVDTPTKEDRIKEPKVGNLPRHMFADGGGVSNTTRVDRMTPDSKMRKTKKKDDEGCVVFRETFEHKFADTCGGGRQGDGGRFVKRRDRSEVNEIAIEEIREIYSYDDDINRRRSSVRGKDSPANYAAEASTTDGGSVVAYNPATACTDNWFFSWW